MSDTTANCQCGQVVFEARGKPILSAVCYCDDCQAAAREIEAGGGPPVADPDGGTALTLYREDRFVCVAGADRLQVHKLTPGSRTFRRVAACCGSAMNIGFENGPFWVSVMDNRLSPKPVPEARIKTKFRTSDAPYPDDAPVYAHYSWSMIAKMLGARIGMILGR